MFDWIEYGQHAKSIRNWLDQYGVAGLRCAERLDWNDWED